MQAVFVKLCVGGVCCFRVTAVRLVLSGEKVCFLSNLREQDVQNSLKNAQKITTNVRKIVNFYCILSIFMID